MSGATSTLKDEEGNYHPTPSDPMVAYLSPSLTPFGDIDFLLVETDAFLSLDDSIPSGIDNDIYNSEGDVYFLEELLNDDPTNDIPSLKELKNDETKTIKSSTEDPPELELKDLPPHFEYAFLEGTSKLPVIISKDLKREEKDQLIKILMEDDFKPTVQHQRRINPKIHKVFKAEVIKLLNAGWIYPISDTHWALKWTNFDLKTASDHRKVQRNELNELRDQAYENSLIYKEKTKKIHKSKIKNQEFHVGDRVILFNSRLKIFSGKLKSHWSGPFTITEVFPSGTVELSQPNGPNFKVNGHWIKHYHRGDVPAMDVSDLQTRARWTIEDGTRAVLFELEMCTWSNVVSGPRSTSLEEEEGLGGGTEGLAKVTFTSSLGLGMVLLGSAP
nr:reverse transcriptase domain-containing protein [Tanacetum cinerariifolium]